jgi:hypothetical protein
LHAAPRYGLAIKARDVVVPPLSGKTVNEATGIVGGAGLNLKVEESAARGRGGPGRTRSSARIPRRVQNAARAQREGLGQRGTRAPCRCRRCSASRSAAGARAPGRAAAGPGRRECDPPTTRSAHVIAQNRRPRSAGARLALLVNRRESSGTYVMPDLIGVNGDRAADLLRGRGFRVSVVGDHPYPGVPAGIVLRQSPQGGFQIGMSDPISLEVSR